MRIFITSIIGTMTGSDHCALWGCNAGGGGGGYSGINVTRCPTEPNILHPKNYMDLILCTQKNTRLEILDPKKYMTFIP